MGINKENNRKRILVVAIILLAVALDQCFKVYVKTHFQLGEARQVLPWFWICFVENDGMAFGIEWFSKLLLTLFRIAAVGVLGWYIHRLITKYADTPHPWGYLVMIALVTAGAIGNIIDCLFYGLIWDYAPLCYGKVVDMLYFPLITDSAGETLFFRPVFNLADSCITVAVLAILIFFRDDLNESLK